MFDTLCHETLEDVESRERHLGTTYVGLIVEAWETDAVKHGGERWICFMQDVCYIFVHWGIELVSKCCCVSSFARLGPSGNVKRIKI